MASRDASTLRMMLRQKDVHCAQLAFSLFSPWGRAACSQGGSLLFENMLTGTPQGVFPC